MTRRTAATSGQPARGSRAHADPRHARWPHREGRWLTWLIMCQFPRWSMYMNGSSCVPLVSFGSMVAYVVMSSVQPPACVEIECARSMMDGSIGENNRQQRKRGNSEGIEGNTVWTVREERTTRRRGESWLTPLLLTVKSCTMIRCGRVGRGCLRSHYPRACTPRPRSTTSTPAHSAFSKRGRLSITSQEAAAVNNALQNDDNTSFHGALCSQRKQITPKIGSVGHRGGEQQEARAGVRKAHTPLLRPRVSRLFGRSQ